MSTPPSAIDLAVRALERTLTATLTRRSVASHPIDPLATLLQASAAFSSETVFDLCVDGVARAEATEAWLASWFAGLTDPFARDHFGGLTLATRGDPPLTLQYFRDLMTEGVGYDQIRISFPRPWLDGSSAPPAWAAPSRLFDYLRVAAAASGADVAWLYSFDLFAVVRAATTGDYDDELGVPRELANRFSRLLPSEEIDRAAVPEAIGWANVWSRDVVERLGRVRVESCPWERCTRGDAGELLLVATDVCPERTRLDAMRQVSELVDCMSLAEAHRANPPAREDS